ncbi:hypothetical protein [Roseibacillus persicicus]|uniref:hypothetical protein n=1 Tax=Roseibacillus persicicus TaxID=454148 RepID=UPI00167AA3B5|nr:hypothetical protein [Roseibacillus persicicus]
MENREAEGGGRVISDRAFIAFTFCLPIHRIFQPQKGSKTAKRKILKALQLQRAVVLFVSLIFALFLRLFAAKIPQSLPGPIALTNFITTKMNRSVQSAFI